MILFHRKNIFTCARVNLNHNIFRNFSAKSFVVSKKILLLLPKYRSLWRPFNIIYQRLSRIVPKLPMILELRLCAFLVLCQEMNKQRIVTWMFVLRPRLPILFCWQTWKSFWKHFSIARWMWWEFIRIWIHFFNQELSEMESMRYDKGVVLDYVALYPSLFWSRCWSNLVDYRKRIATFEESNSRDDKLLEIRQSLLSSLFRLVRRLFFSLCPLTQHFS